MVENTKKVPEYYRRTYARWYRWFAYIYDPFERIWCFIFNGGFGGARRFRELIVEWLDPQPGEKIVDICSGTGTLSILIGERLAGAGEIVGIELSPAQLKMARRKSLPEGLSFIEGDARNIPFSESYFDRGVISGALHELPREVRQSVLREAFRVIRPKGRIVVVEQNKPNEKWKALLFDWMERLNPEYQTYKELLQCGLVNEIRNAGFNITRTETTFWDFFQIVEAER
jgi:ubiquinone/menaquinone biosynthesis C-methylase UbiE